MFAGWGSWVARFRWPVLTVALVAVVSAGIWGLGVFGQLTEGGYNDPNSESTRAAAMVQQALGAPAGDVVAIYTPTAGKIDDAALAKRIKARLGALPKSAVTAQSSYWQQKTAQSAASYVAKDRSSAVAVITLAGPDDAAKLDQFRQIKNDFTVDGAAVQLAGGVPLNDASSARSTADLGTAELISLPITLVLLLFIFGSLVAAALPVLVGSLAVLGSLGILHAVAMHNDVNSFAVNVASLLGLGMAIDYGLFMVGRFREEQAHGRTPAEAVRRTVGTAGRTVLFSATLLMIALSGLLLFPQGFLNSLAYGGLSAVALAAFLSLTLLPALLAVLGHRVDKLPIRLPRRRGAAPAGSGWARMAARVLRRPVLVALPILGILVLLAWPVRGVHFADSDERILPAGDPARVAIEVLKADYPQFTNNGIQIVLRGVQDAGGFTTAVRAVPGVDQLGPAVKTAQGTIMTATLSSDDPFSPAARDAVDKIRDLPLPAGAQLLVGGTTARNLDSLHATAAKLPLMVALLAGATLVLMFLAFGSILLPIKAVLMSALSLSATFGVLVWIFQDGHLAGLLDVTPAPLEVGIVVLMAAVVFGLSTDYEVFLLSRMVEARTRGASTAEAVTTGLARTGRVISAAAVLLIVVTGAFGLSAVSTMRFVGVGMIVALLLDATVVRMLLVPAVLGLLGDAAWWAPGPLRRLQQRAGLSEYAGDELFPAASVGRHAAPDDTMVLPALPASTAQRVLVPELLFRDRDEPDWASPSGELAGLGSARPLVLPGRSADATVVFPAFSDDRTAVSNTLRIELESAASEASVPPFPSLSPGSGSSDADAELGSWDADSSDSDSDSDSSDWGPLDSNSSDWGPLEADLLDAGSLDASLSSAPSPYEVIETVDAELVEEPGNGPDVEATGIIPIGADEEIAEAELIDADTVPEAAEASPAPAEPLLAAAAEQFPNPEPTPTGLIREPEPHLAEPLVAAAAEQFADPEPAAARDEFPQSPFSIMGSTAVAGLDAPSPAETIAADTAAQFPNELRSAAETTAGDEPFVAFSEPAPDSTAHQSFVALSEPAPDSTAHQPFGPTEPVSGQPTPEEAFAASSGPGTSHADGHDSVDSPMTWQTAGVVDRFQPQEPTPTYNKANSWDIDWPAEATWSAAATSPAENAADTWTTASGDGMWADASAGIRGGDGRDAADSAAAWEMAGWSERSEPDATIEVPHDMASPEIDRLSEASWTAGAPESAAATWSAASDGPAESGDTGSGWATDSAETAWVETGDTEWTGAAEQVAGTAGAAPAEMAGDFGGAQLDTRLTDGPEIEGTSTTFTRGVAEVTDETFGDAGDFAAAAEGGRVPDVAAVADGNAAGAGPASGAGTPLVVGSGADTAAVVDGDVAYEIMAQAGGKPAARPEAEPTAFPAGVEAQAGLLPEAEPERRAALKPDAIADAELNARAPMNAQASTGAKPPLFAQTSPPAPAEPDADARVWHDAQAERDPRAAHQEQARAELDVHAELDAHTELDGSAQLDTPVEFDGQADPDPQAEPGTHAELDAQAQADTHAEHYAQAEADTHAEPDARVGLDAQAEPGDRAAGGADSDTPVFAGTGSLAYAALFPHLFAPKPEPEPERYNDDWSAPVSEDAFFAPAASDPFIYRMEEPAADERYVTHTPADEEQQWLAPVAGLDDRRDVEGASEPAGEPWIPESRFEAAAPAIAETRREPVFEVPVREPALGSAAADAVPAGRRPADLSELAAAWRQVIENRPPAAERPADLAGYVGQRGRRPVPEQSRAARPADPADRRPADLGDVTGGWRAAPGGLEGRPAELGAYGSGWPPAESWRRPETLGDQPAPPPRRPASLADSMPAPRRPRDAEPVPDYSGYGEPEESQPRA